MKQKLKKLTVGTPNRCISPATHQIIAFDGLHSALQKLACEARCNGIGNWCNMRLRVIEISRALASHELVNGHSVHSNGAFPENFPCSISLGGSDELLIAKDNESMERTCHGSHDTKAKYAHAMGARKRHST